MPGRRRERIPLPVLAAGEAAKVQRTQRQENGIRKGTRRVGRDMTDDSPSAEQDPVEIPIDGVLDLHTFRPADAKDLVPAYLEECRKRGILHVRIIHGKGTGALRETVHAVLRRTPGVADFGLAPGNAGGWGATIVTLSGTSDKTPKGSPEGA
jgi:dsDNA-specific endonuclease/ATPase MutS2